MKEVKRVRHSRVFLDLPFLNDLQLRPRLWVSVSDDSYCPRSAR